MTRKKHKPIEDDFEKFPTEYLVDISRNKLELKRLKIQREAIDAAEKTAELVEHYEALSESNRELLYAFDPLMAGAMALFNKSVKILGDFSKDPGKVNGVDLLVLCALAEDHNKLMLRAVEWVTYPETMVKPSEAFSLAPRAPTTREVN